MQRVDKELSHMTYYYFFPYLILFYIYFVITYQFLGTIKVLKTKQNKDYWTSAIFPI